MELSEKLQELRKEKGLTQEELAEALFVSRTAISKWESGRGVPNIESLKAISKFFSVSIDELLSGEEILKIADEDNKQKEKHTRDLVFGLLDCSLIMFLFLPFFGQKGDEIIKEVWSQVLYGIGYSDDQIVTVALSQVGNVGGQPYWSWYGFDSRVEWCACFVSWCANECGYIDAGIIPKYAGCVNGVQWFRDRGQWADGSYEPSPGTIIFFDWEGDGVTDHTGIVQKCENGTVYTVEGNSGDTCRTKTYPVGSSVIYGYGIPAY